jgi:hypothetical protein
MLPRISDSSERWHRGRPGLPEGENLACRAAGTIFVGGLTTPVIFADEMSADDFADRVGRAAGNPVAHDEIAPGIGAQLA